MSTENKGDDVDRAKKGRGLEDKMLEKYQIVVK